MQEQKTFFEAVQIKVARTTITSSSMRGPGCGAAIKTARAYTGDLDLHRFSCRTRIAFNAELNDATAELCSAMPRAIRSWGLARKGLNIFLRECLYTWYLRDHSRLDRSERFFELPLDSLTGRALRRTDPELPRWDSVRRLTPELSSRFQDAAKREGYKRRLARVHLDVFWWGYRGEDA